MTSEPSPAPGPLNAVFDALDPRLAPECRRSFETLRTAQVPSTRPWRGSLVLAGHRASGKSRLLPFISALVGVQGVDLDAELERKYGRPLRSWVTEDLASFRAAERALFEELPPGGLLAVGGGFLALHADLLKAHTPVLIPISLETYRERLLADATRPRLRPDLSPEEEISTVFHERERAHAATGAMPLINFLAGLPGAGR
ncbi:MAG TPA: shikimate kinase [Myxococcaceae bacterium]|nr:shikimate kinase [Myxococcaceae bacterium]